MSKQTTPPARYLDGPRPSGDALLKDASRPASPATRPAPRPQAAAKGDAPSPDHGAPPAPRPRRELSGVRLRVQGRRLEKLLLRLEEQGIHPRDVRRESLRAMSLTINPHCEQGFDRVCVELGIEIARRRPLGVTRALRHLRRRAALPICAAVCVLLLGLMSTRVWRVQVDAPPELCARLESALDSLGVRPGAAKSAIDLRSLETAVAAGVDEVKFCQARVRGVTFTLTAQRADAAPETLTLTPAGGLYARRDAVVERIQVLAGRAVVARGDAVRAGDLLIAGEEQATREETAQVKAMGIVTGRVWYEGRGEVPLSETVLERTGRQSTRRVLCLPFAEFTLAAGADFSLCEREVTTQPIGGLFVPFCVQTTRLWELRERESERPLDEAKALAEELARQNAVKKCPDNAFVIDKWSEYSIIEGNIIEARYIIEAEETIQCGG